MKATDILKQEHRYIERMLTLLEKAAAGLEKGEHVSPQVFTNALHFIRTFADGCHHGKEESLFFPAMEQKGFPREAGPIAIMLQEHKLGRVEVRAMDEALQRYAAGVMDATEDLSIHARNFVGLLREHIMKEDNILFVMADRQMSEEDQKRLLEGFQEMEESGPACSIKNDLIELLENMELDLRRAVPSN